MNSGEVVKTLGSLGEGNRYSAIASLARGGQIRSPLSSSDGASILFGTTQGARASSISELAPLFKADLSGLEAETILGPEATLSEGNRLNGIAALARTKRFGPSLGEDAALALKGATQGSRAAAIAEIAPYLRADLPGQAIATILGSGTLLSDSNRLNAIAAIARSGKKPLPLSGPDGAAILQGATQGARTAAIGELAPLFKTNLSGLEAEAILGPEATLSEGNRLNAIAALARAKRFGPSLGEDAALALKGATQGSRAAAIAEIAPYLRADLSGQSIATILGRNGELAEGNRYNAIAALARAGKLGAVLSSDEMAAILLGTSGQTRVSALAEVTNAAKRQGATPASVGTTPSIPRPSTSGIPIDSLPFPSSTAGTTPTSIGGAAVAGTGVTAGLDGTYYNQELRFGFLITGNQGIATVSNSLKYKPGDVMLRFSPSSPKAFTGQQLCTDGVFHPVTGTLSNDGSIDMVIQGCSPSRYKMVRQGTSAPTQPRDGNYSTTTPVLEPSRGPSTPMVTASAVSAASIDTRIARLRHIESTQLPYLYESTSAWSGNPPIFSSGQK